MTVPSLEVVDAHQHFWDLDANPYPWLRDAEPIAFRYGDYSALRRNYLPADYRRDTAGTGKAYAKETFAKWPALAKVQSFNEDGTLYPVTPRWSRVVDSLQPAIEAIGSGSPAKATLDDAARQANRVLRRV